MHRQESAGAIYSEVHLWAEAKLECPVWSLGVSRSGILCGTDDGRVILYDTNLVHCQTLAAHGSSAVLGVEWSEDCLHFLSVGTDKTIKVWSVEHFRDAPAREAVCLFSLYQLTPVIAAAFHPLTFSSQAPAPVTVFVLTGDRRIGVWTNGVVERYESLSSKDPPVCLSVHLRDFRPSSFSMDHPLRRAVVLALGTKTGDLLLYAHSPEKGIGFESSLSCRNRRGTFKDGTPVVAVCWVSGTEMLVSSQDNRVRLVRLCAEKNKSTKMSSRMNRPALPFELRVVGKLAGHKSAAGEAPLGAFVLRPPFAAPIVQCGSECGRIFVWPLSVDEKCAAGRSSVLSRISKKLKPSRALKAKESWFAVQGTDKLTGAAPAPWNPEKGTIGGSCTVTVSLEGYVRLFFNRSKETRRRASSSASIAPPEVSGVD